MENSKKNCDFETRYQRLARVDDLMSIVNILFFLANESEDENSTLLNRLDEAKAKIVKNNHSWRMNNEITLNVQRLFRLIDAVDINSSWDHEDNKFWAENFTGFSFNFFL